MSLTGCFEPDSYENIIRMLFDHNGGVLFNFEAMFANEIRSFCQDDFAT